MRSVRQRPMTRAWAIIQPWQTLMRHRRTAGHLDHLPQPPASDITAVDWRRSAPSSATALN